MAKPSSLIALLDSSANLNATNVPAAIGGVPFVRHQFNWLLVQLATKPSSEAVVMLAGYTGVKKITPGRVVRLEEMVRIIQNRPIALLEALPLPALPATPVKP